MENADGGDLFNYVKKQKAHRKYIAESKIWHFLIQILRGLKVLHDQKILHRDIKCSNIFLTKENNVKLGDLNVSKIAKKGMLYTQTGTPYYASPEVWSDKPYNTKSDIWSLGCVLYEICALQPPFKSDDMQALHKKILKGVFLPLPKHYSSDLDLTVKSMLKVGPNLRPTVAQLLESKSIAAHITETKPKEESKNAKPPLMHGHLLDTIRLPKNLRVLKERLPRANYGLEGRTSSVEGRRSELVSNEDAMKKIDISNMAKPLSKQGSKGSLGEQKRLSKENIKPNKALG